MLRGVGHNLLHTKTAIFMRRKCCLPCDSCYITVKKLGQGVKKSSKGANMLVVLSTWSSQFCCYAGEDERDEAELLAAALQEDSEAEENSVTDI